jgi:hypothetical protein
MFGARYRQQRHPLVFAHLDAGTQTARSCVVHVICLRRDRRQPGRASQGRGVIRMSELRRAIAIRQPFAWAVIHGGKDVESRTIRARRLFESAVGERVLIHASKGMTAAEYENAATFMASIGVRYPSARRCSSAA